jgi:DHA1 family inner membrane transport protein
MPPRRLVLELAAAALARLFLDTARRFAYPFAPALARGLEVPLTSVTSPDGYVWLWGGLAATGVAASALSALALGLLAWGLRGWHPAAGMMPV